MAPFEARDRAFVRQFLTKRFDLAELKSLAFDLGVSYDELPHDTRDEFCLELIGFFERRGNVGCLLIEVARLRPDDVIERLAAAHGMCSPREKIVVIAPEELSGKLADFMQRFAKEYGLSPEEVQLLATAPGSIQLLLGLPGSVAERLLSAPPTTLGGYPIHAIRRFFALPPAAQSTWRAIAVQGAPTAASAVGASVLVRLLALLLTVTVIGTVAIYAAAPRLVIDNACGEPFPLDQEYPLIGGEIAPGQTTYRLPPGTWEVTYTGQMLGLSSSLVSLPPIPIDPTLRITVDGAELAPRPEPFEQSVGLGTRIEVELCPDD